MTDASATDQGTQEVRVAGVDEVGRGPIAGPVVAAAVIFQVNEIPQGLRDSKRLSARQREGFCRQIKESALAWAIAECSVEEIDQINILEASLLAMQRAVAKLAVKPTRVLVDGNRCPEFGIPAEAMIGGDCLNQSISAASIVAKVYRDSLMEELDGLFPAYGFARHKGYPTAQHIAALEARGPCALHRRSFGPVKKILAVS